MQIISVMLAITAGICFGLGVLHLFLGFRVIGEKITYLLFAFFALSYGFTALGSMTRFNSQTLEQFLTLARWGYPAFCSAYIFLIWFVAFYTKLIPGKLSIIFLGLMTAVFLFIGYQMPKEVSEIVFATLPWGEQITLSKAAGNTWFLFWIAVPVVSIYIFIATIRQYRRGERKEAVVLGIGLLFLSITIIFDTLIDMGLVNFFYLSDFGFLPMAIVMSMQLSNKMVVIQKELSHYQRELEIIVDERTSQLKIANEKLAQDVTKREQIEKSLRQSERRARALLNAPPDSALLLDTEGTILDINTIAAERLGVNIEEARGANINNLFDPEIYEFRMTKIQEVITHKKSERWEDVRNGRTIDNNLYPILDDDGNVNSIAVFGADITELKLLQLREKESAAEEERKRLARDLHDAVTQTIYSASLIAEVLPQVWERNPDEGRRNLTKLRALVRGALAEMRTMLFELRPNALEAANFATLLGQLGDALHGRTRIPVHVECEHNLDLIPAVKVTLYRIAQEAVNNIIKHAGATETQLALKQQSGQILLRVWDNGRGFDPTKVPNGGLGIVIMRERAESIGAEFDVVSRPGQGTQVSVRWMEPILEENEV